MTPASLLAAFVLTSTAFYPGGTIPRAYTCEGRGVSPPLQWTRPPAGTKAFGITMIDTDAHFTHWVAWGIPTSTRGLVAGQRPPRQARNSFGHTGYGGPCPPPGPQHHYVFTVYALDRNVGPSFAGHVLAHARLTGLFRR